MPSPVTAAGARSPLWGLLLAGALVLGCAPTAPDTGATAANVTADEGMRHFAYFARDRQRIHAAAFLACPGIAGAQLLYAWKELEGEESVYDLTPVQKDLDFLAASGKQLFIELQDTTFDPAAVAVPRYLLNDPRYHGGVVYQYDERGHPEGVVARRWDPAVAVRLRALLAALGRQLDGKVAGITLQETAVDVSAEGPHAVPGFTYAGYRDAIRGNMEALKHAFPRSVAMQYLNYMPGEWLPDDDHSYLRSLYEYAQRTGIAVGAPDLMPKNGHQQAHAYRFMHALKGRMQLGIAVQDGNYTGTTGQDTPPSGPWPDPVPALYAYARAYLGVSYIFWGGQEPYFTRNVLPFLAAQSNAGPASPARRRPMGALNSHKRPQT